VFDSPDLATPTSTPPVLRVESISEPIAPLAPELFERTPPPVDRQRRGKLYVRVVAAVGIALTLFVLWQVLTKL
jgi:hypothetical protein